MRLPPHLLHSFKQAYKELSGEDLTDEEADRLGFWFVDFLGTAVTIHAEQSRRQRDGGSEPHSS